MFNSPNKIIKVPTRTIQQYQRYAGRSINSKIVEQEILREQLHNEIESKIKACSNPTYDCSIARVEGYDYCIRHILQDPRAPYKLCTYVYSNGKKCSQAAPKNDPKKDPALTTYCFEHSRLVQLSKTRNTIGKYKSIETNESLLNELTHHLAIQKLKLQNVEKDMEDEEIDVVSPNIEPFISYNQICDLPSAHSIQNKKRILDYASDSSSSDGEVLALGTVSKAHEWDNSDNESVDSQDDDLLKHAGIYSTEEATLIAKQKMLKLQNLYVNQINRLHYLLKEKRRKYLQSIRKERETLCKIHDQSKGSAQERRLYEKLKALNHYHHRYGVEAVLYKKFKEKRVKLTEGLLPKALHPLTKCIFTEGGVKCGQKQLVGCKYCKKHILEDKRQTLFRACGVEKSGVVCQEPVPNIFDDATCTLHINIPPVDRVYVQKKYESETEEEDNAVGTSSKHSTIKKELNEDGNTLNIKKNVKVDKAKPAEQQQIIFNLITGTGQ